MGLRLPAATIVLIRIALLLRNERHAFSARRICPPKYLLPTNHFQKNPKSASLCAVALVALVCGSSIAMPAQTAHFGGVQTTVATGFNYPAAVAVDSSGDIYVADFLNHVAKEIVAVNGAFLLHQLFELWEPSLIRI